MNGAALNSLFVIPETIEKLVFPSQRSEDSNDRHSLHSIPVDIIEAPKEYIFFLDIPGLSKTDIQVTVEEERTLVIRSNGKRKRGDTEEEVGCKYIRLERRPLQNVTRKFRLPEDANTAATTAKCENGVLTVSVEKLPPAKPKTVEIVVS